MDTDIENGNWACCCRNNNTSSFFIRAGLRLQGGNYQSYEIKIFQVKEIKNV